MDDDSSLPDWYLNAKEYMEDLMKQANIFKDESNIEQLDLDSLTLVGKIVPYMDYKAGELTWDPDTEGDGYVNLLTAKENFTSLFREVLRN